MSRGRNGDWLTYMTGQISLFVSPKFSAIIGKTGHFFLLKQLKKRLLEML